MAKIQQKVNNNDEEQQEVPEQKPKKEQQPKKEKPAEKKEPKPKANEEEKKVVAPIEKTKQQNPMKAAFAGLAPEETKKANPL